MNFIIRFFIFFFLTFSVLAENVPSALPPENQGTDSKVLSALLSELPVEIGDFDQTREPESVVNEFKADWQAYLSSGKLNEKWLHGYSWSKYLKDYFQELKQSQKEKKNFKLSVATMPKFHFTKVSSDKDHSIHDPDLYVEQRIGALTIETIKKNNLDVILFGGDEESLEKELDFTIESAVKLPSPYEVWGIKKYFIPSEFTVDGKPKYLLVMPPSKEYLTHYAQMFDYVDVKNTFAHLSTISIAKEKLRLRKIFADYRAQLSRRSHNEIEGVFLGYFNELTNSSAQVLKIISEQKLEMGLTIAELQDTITSKYYFALKSDLTIWGESSSRIVEALLETFRPREIVFMGSAGGPTNSTTVYDLSVPQEFYLNRKVLPIRNFVYDELTRKGQDTVGIFLGGRHGHTNSPIEQTIDYVDGKINQNITSFDVEQNLIAEVVVNFNSETHSNVRFGALNLITDKPKNSIFTASPLQDLTRINKEKKSDSRKRAVAIAIDAVRSTGTFKHEPGTLKIDFPIEIKPKFQKEKGLQCLKLLDLAS